MRGSRAIPPTVLTALEQLVEQRTGLFFAESRRSEFVGKASRAFAASGCATWEDYLTGVAARDGNALLEQLIEALTVGETYFLRHRPYIDRLEREVLPSIIARLRDTRRLRIWCAGCATGEEAYSLAILVRQCLPDLRDWDVSILASDLNRQFLKRAEAGVYGSWSFRETDERFIAAYFTREDARYRIRPEIRRMVQFRHINLVEDASVTAALSASAFDLILCRNVLIYFASATSKRVVARLRAALVPEGWLVLGPSDWSPDLLHGFQAHPGPDAVIYQRVEIADPAPAVPIWSPSAQPPAGEAAAVDGASRRAAASPPHRAASNPKASTTAARGEPARSVDARQPAAESDWQTAWRAASASANRGDLAEAEAHCRRAIAAATFRPEPYYLLGMLCHGKGDDGTAMAAFRQALYIDRGFVPALLAVAAIQRQAGQLAQARQTLARAQQQLAGRPADEVLLAEEGLTVGRLRDALTQAWSDAIPRSVR